jgi:flavin reductase (DIM6/NTAB) family NADH-FMN oxidoreductase RutF
MSLPSTTIASNVPIEAPDKESLIKRNPHVDFPTVEAARSSYSTPPLILTKTPTPGWIPGTGASDESWRQHAARTIDPNGAGRATIQNYKLMISTTIPRPIALVSTTSSTGVKNLAPFSYFQAVSMDPPLYSLSFVGEDPNDSLRNVLESGECCISLISDWFIEAANYTSINTPPHISEWELAGLCPMPSQLVKAPYVAESAFSVECKIHSSQDIMGKSGKRSATLVLVEAVMFHVREDVVDEAGVVADPGLLRAIWRGGGITYGICTNVWELPRPEPWRVERERQEVKKLEEKIGGSV